MSVEKITKAEVLKRFAEQGVSAPKHYAVKCVVCETVQSMASLVKAGDTPKGAEGHFGFSCEGRLTNVGPLPSEKARGKRADARRQMRGCDWTLGGLFTIHKLVIIDDDDPKKEHPFFELASPEEAQKLEAWVTAEGAQSVPQEAKQ